jgi:hypothetical protein
MDVQHEYQRRIDALSPKQRMERAAAMLAWSREIIARRLIAEHGPMSAERLKWEVALRQYGADPATRALIQEKLDHVSD